MLFLPDKKAIPAAAKATPLALGYFMLSVHRFSALLRQQRAAEILIEDLTLREEQPAWLSADFLAAEEALVKEWLQRRGEFISAFQAQTEAFITANYGGKENTFPGVNRRLLRLAAGRKIDVTINGLERGLEVSELMGESYLEIQCRGLPEGRLRLCNPQRVTYGTMPAKEQAVLDALKEESLVERVERIIFPQLTEEGDAFAASWEENVRFAELRKWEEGSKIPAVLNGVILPTSGLPDGVEMRPGLAAAGIEWQWLAHAGLAPYWTAPAKALLTTYADKIASIMSAPDRLAETVGRFYWPAVAT